MIAFRCSASVLSVALLLLIAAPLAGQDRRGPRGPQERQEMEERFRARMGRMIQERLGLADEELVELQGLMEQFQQDRRELARAEQATRRRVEALMLEGGADHDEARDLLQRLAEARRAESRLFEEEQEALLGILTPVQVLQLHAVREQISRRIRALRGRRGPGDGRPGGRAPGNVDGPLGIDVSMMGPGG